MTIRADLALPSCFHSSAPALLNRGVSLYQLGRLQQALENFERALALEPRNVKALYNRASVLHELRRFDESLATFEQTLALAPDYAEAQWNEGLTRLLLGDFERGWQQYEWRWKTESQRHQRRDFAQPLWLGGEALTGKIILVHAEQGFVARPISQDASPKKEDQLRLTVDYSRLVISVKIAKALDLAGPMQRRLLARQKPMSAIRSRLG